MDIEFEKLGTDKVVINLDDFEDMLDALAFDRAAVAAHGEAFPFEIAERLLAGENPVRVYRTYRNMTQTTLASQIGLSQAAIAEIESGRKMGSTASLKKIAQALNVDLDDLV
ncbi:MAG: helix-turn-helix transcriptional regulator [Rhodospirillales bacterium]|nr:helix-turn-helix transcriptional regulator [Alphaproteobacteria bacterium]MCB9981035.1 helix-turn-helix transcriptional regulator [Rhodospirillales bacterium]